MNYSNPLDAVPDVSLETRLIITENQCVLIIMTAAFTECPLPGTLVKGENIVSFPSPETESTLSPPRPCMQH